MRIDKRISNILREICWAAFGPPFCVAGSDSAPADAQAGVFGVVQNETLGDKAVRTVLYSMGVNKNTRKKEHKKEKRKGTFFMMTLTSCMLIISAASIIDLIVR